MGSHRNCLLWPARQVAYRDASCALSDVEAAIREIAGTYRTPKKTHADTANDAGTNALLGKHRDTGRVYLHLIVQANIAVLPATTAGDCR